jgi:hypothetical protein
VLTAFRLEKKDEVAGSGLDDNVLLVVGVETAPVLANGELANVEKGEFFASLLRVEDKVTLGLVVAATGVTEELVLKLTPTVGVPRMLGLIGVVLVALEEVSLEGVETLGTFDANG